MAWLKYEQIHIVIYNQVLFMIGYNYVHIETSSMYDYVWLIYI